MTQADYETGVQYADRMSRAMRAKYALPAGWHGVTFRTLEADGRTQITGAVCPPHEGGKLKLPDWRRRERGTEFTGELSPDEIRAMDTAAEVAGE